jgi:hypothetical protein
MTIDEIARVLAWADGCNAQEIQAASSEVLWLDSAQQCLEDLDSSLGIS